MVAAVVSSGISGNAKEGTVVRESASSRTRLTRSESRSLTWADPMKCVYVPRRRPSWMAAYSWIIVNENTSDSRPQSRSFARMLQTMCNSPSRGSRWRPARHATSGLSRSASSFAANTGR